ncbi:phage tail tape measure protein [Roseateles sp. SL47]|uniref:phage tail tape measure protein n=1 Tax=Roseateles sp. SL47 TaxID=2995138 RepID=UPI0022712489|nr:phage tail tape measure protein [Roseateles sp. SL47]WAC71115.1 phage tail tape measure protein [Roseateles sp. SL47]
MADPLKLSLDLSLNDRLVGPLKRALGEVRSELGKVVSGLNKIAGVGDQAARGLALVGARTSVVGRAAQEAERGLRGMQSELGGLAERSSKVADNLQKLNREAAGLRNLARATKEVGDASKDAERKTNAFNRVRAAAGVVAGATAASAVIAAPARRAADYDTELRSLANTAYAGQSLDARRDGLRGLDASITSAVRAGGGTREQALSTLNELVASGVFTNVTEATAMLPTLQRAGTASGASPVELARIAIRARQTFGIPSDQTGRVLGMAMASGQAGGFELKDMAKWLPQQMAAARSLGLSGTSGLAQLLAANQASVITAGSKDEAGNNLVNLLAKINSSDTANDFKKLGIDLPGTLAAARGKGVDGLNAFVNMVDKIVASDPRFMEARQGASSASNDERRASFSAQQDILQGSAIGKVIQDRQALMSLVGLMNNRAYVGDVLKTTEAGDERTISEALALFQEGAGYKFDQRAFEVQQAQTQAMNASNSVIAKLAEAQTDLYKRYPGFGEALEGAKVAVTAFSAAVAASGLVNLLTGGGGGLIARGAGAALGAGGSLVAAAGGAGALAVGGAGVLAAGAVGYGAGSLAYKGIEGTKVADGIGETIAQVMTFFGNQEAQEALNSNRQAEAAQALEAAAAAMANRPPIKVMINGREITSVVDEQVEWYSRRQ